MVKVTMERISSHTTYEGAIFTVQQERWQRDDGLQVIRDVIRRASAVAVIAYDQDGVWLVHQPREAIGEASFLELPAGMIDGDEAPLVAAQRELREELGITADSWTPVASVYLSPGASDEMIHIYAATGLTYGKTEWDPEERIEPVRCPLQDLPELIGRVQDAKTLAGLLWLDARKDS